MRWLSVPRGASRVCLFARWVGGYAAPVNLKGTLMPQKLTPHYLLHNAEQYANEAALSIKTASGAWQTFSWREIGDETVAIGKSLLALGFERDDKLSIYSYNRREWYTCYAAAQLVAGAAVAVYHTCSPEEVSWVVGNSETKVVFVGSNPQAGDDPEKVPGNRLAVVLDALKDVEVVVMMEGVPAIDHPKVMDWNTFIAKGRDVSKESVLERLEGVKATDTASLIYTSGTTGNPKGVELSHDNFAFELESIDGMLGMDRGDSLVSWLPLAHVFGQLVDNHLWIKYALHTRVVDSPLNVVDYMKEVQPHLFVGVPRIYEKLYSNLKSTLDAKPALKLLLRLPVVKGVLQGAVKKKIGMSNCKIAITGAAPINQDILRFFHFIGVPLFEGYGMTETTAGASVNYHNNFKFGSVGRAIPGTELKTDKDGEIMFRGRHVMKGYYKNEQATAEVMDDGWLRSGDIGEIDRDGYVKITGRKKELYVSSAGKNIAPLLVEETMKSIPIVSQCYLVGDDRKFCSALFTLDAGALLRDKFGMDPLKIPRDPVEQMKLLEEKGKPIEAFASSQEIHDEIQKHVTELNRKFSSPEQVKKFTILPRDFTIDAGELTPTLKIRRKQINSNWSSEIDGMYSA